MDLNISFPLGVQGAYTVPGIARANPLNSERCFIVAAFDNYDQKGNSLVNDRLIPIAASRNQTAYVNRIRNIMV